MNFVPFLGDFDNPGTIPVDINFGVSPQPAVFADPKGVNHYLVQLGYPDSGPEAAGYDEENYGGVGRMTAMSFAWFATCGQRNLDSRYTIDEARQKVDEYIADDILPAGFTIFDFFLENLRVNPRWQELNTRQLQVR